MVLLLKVTQDKIDNGCKAKAGSCPVALALMEHIDKFPGAVRAVAWSTIGFIDYDGNYVARVTTPSGVWRRMCDFDEGKKIRPFEFEVNLG